MKSYARLIGLWGKTEPNHRDEGPVTSAYVMSIVALFHHPCSWESPEKLGDMVHGLRGPLAGWLESDNVTTERNTGRRSSGLASHDDGLDIP